MAGRGCTRVIKKSRSEKIVVLMEPRRERFLQKRETVGGIGV
jgi:hypothetical protein